MINMIVFFQCWSYCSDPRHHPKHMYCYCQFGSIYFTSSH